MIKHQTSTLHLHFTLRNFRLIAIYHYPRAYKHGYLHATTCVLHYYLVFSILLWHRIATLECLTENQKWKNESLICWPWHNERWVRQAYHCLQEYLGLYSLQTYSLNHRSLSHSPRLIHRCWLVQNTILSTYLVPGCPEFECLWLTGCFLSPLQSRG